VSISQEIALSIVVAIAVVGMLTAIGIYLMIGIAWQEFQRRQSEISPAVAARSPMSMLGTALRGRCPNCGGGKISRSIFYMNLSCPVCGISFVHGEGEWIGPVVINYSAALAAALITWAILVIMNASEALQIIAAAIVAITAGVAIVPLSRSVWTLFLYLNHGIEMSCGPRADRR
jgi:uncharacterized protein (DUF983 family)